jgi:hypothetical protein
MFSKKPTNAVNVVQVTLFLRILREALNTLEAGGSYRDNRKAPNPTENLALLLVQRYSEPKQMQSAKSMGTKPFRLLMF